MSNTRIPQKVAIYQKFKKPQSILLPQTCQKLSQTITRRELWLQEIRNGIKEDILPDIKKSGAKPLSKNTEKWEYLNLQQQKLKESVDRLYQVKGEPKKKRGYFTPNIKAQSSKIKLSSQSADRPSSTQYQLLTPIYRDSNIIQKSFNQVRANSCKGFGKIFDDNGKIQKALVKVRKNMRKKQVDIEMDRLYKRPESQHDQFMRNYTSSFHTDIELFNRNTIMKIKKVQLNQQRQYQKEKQGFPTVVKFVQFQKLNGAKKYKL